MLRVSHRGGYKKNFCGQVIDRFFFCKTETVNKQFNGKFSIAKI